MALQGKDKQVMFPAPREVDMDLYSATKKEPSKVTKGFPAPFEVDRELYKTFIFGQSNRTVFPASREVDRELYRKVF